MSDDKSNSPNQLLLVRSSRLLALRDKAASSAEPAAPLPNSPQSDEDAHTARLRRLVEQRLNAILATLPAGKQRSLFKIRYGIDLEQLHALPLQKAAEILKIKSGDLKNQLR